ncbi:hypothetical protein ACTMTF_30915 [Nonomuraea sp. ZG12]|uniref:hypothetical protein n=1 Tax=Nonomuraea sp. ZG12 TaxID=3452207 RepID=UPI003F8C0361
MSRVRLGISPIIPTVASFLLAALWSLSVFAGWGLEAFCGSGESSSACSRRLATVSTVSALFAAVAASFTLAAWLVPSARYDPRLFGRLMGTGVVAWIAAEGVLFLGGMLAK